MESTSPIFLYYPYGIYSLSHLLHFILKMDDPVHLPATYWSKFLDYSITSVQLIKSLKSYNSRLGAKNWRLQHLKLVHKGYGSCYKKKRDNLKNSSYVRLRTWTCFIIFGPALLSLNYGKISLSKIREGNQIKSHLCFIRFN
ncbi:hypothetical protein XELAEV_18013318mg [Xenopus laevis]|uniref:Uncharacterized protein n=1 Tax=Xenopus laevis TaxID=8355 RepID=A0A974HZC1_XENLA|nr:hypothetical protein XELAEV_18013318mg [Xenopus laevis]